MEEDEATFAGEVNPWIMSSYFVYSLMLLAKLLFNILLIFLTKVRTRNEPESKDVDCKENKVSRTHPLLTRVIRMNNNDMENFFPFFILGFVYCMTWYAPHWRARLHFRTFVAARMLHSLSHYFAIQPLRSLFYLIAFGVNVSLTIHILYKAELFLKYL